MSAKTPATALLEYLDTRTCQDLDQPDRPGVKRDAVELKRMRDDILDQLHRNPQLADEPLFVKARDYLLDEACCDATDCDVDSAGRLDALRTHLRKEVRTFLAVGGFSKPDPVPSSSARRCPNISANVADGPRILIPIDDSEQSSWAARCGVQMARRLAASVLLVHVTPLPPPVSEGTDRMELSDVATTNEIFARVRDLLPPDLQVNECVREGSPADEILRIAQDWRADLIVMGTHGRGRIARLLLGSVAATVVRRAPCPVVTVARDPAQTKWCIEAADATGNLAEVDLGFEHVR